ncbi:conserved hypothetical protein [Neospora caninum Liverpool]|uniref:Uncharacterized protein n=1 Tax=Neospora caninum (strain Liverpool) TaxID=572307 RepID=F0VDB5_NEOCL|nr:conserved hypothetical protein [Neospora caninum Liverpool]CBZ51630.1 conserved hypothetical protein [Neospora caninum Liverpool]|eukprot:XP_003881663.1 conserved hypothetical protein [Neospora caninum Liverpool]
MEGSSAGAPLALLGPDVKSSVPERDCEKADAEDIERNEMGASSPPARFPLSPACARQSACAPPVSLPEPVLRLVLSQQKAASLLAAVETRIAGDVDACLSGEEAQESLTPFSSPHRLLEDFLRRHFVEKEEAQQRGPAQDQNDRSSAHLASPLAHDAFFASLSSPFPPLSLSFKRPLQPLLPLSLNLRTVFRRQLPPDLVACLRSERGPSPGSAPRYQVLEPLQTLCISRGNEAFLLACLVAESPCLRVGPLSGDILSVHVSPAPVGLLFSAASHLLFFLTPALLHVYAVVLLPRVAPGADSLGKPLLDRDQGSHPGSVVLSADAGTLPLVLPTYVHAGSDAASLPASPSWSGGSSVRFVRSAFRLVPLESLSLPFPETLRSRFSRATPGVSPETGAVGPSLLSSTLDGAVFLFAPDAASAADEPNERRRARPQRLGDIYQLLLRPGPPGRLQSPARLRRLPLSLAGAGALCPVCGQSAQARSGKGVSPLDAPPPHTRGAAGVKLLRCFPARLLAVVDSQDGVYVYRLVADSRRCAAHRRSGACGQGDAADRAEDGEGADSGAGPVGQTGQTWWVRSLLRSASFANTYREEGADEENDSEDETSSWQGWGVGGVVGSVSRKIRRLLARRSSSPSPLPCSSLFPPPSALPLSRLSSALAGPGASGGLPRSNSLFSDSPRDQDEVANEDSSSCVAAVSREAYLEAVVNTLGETSSQTSGPWSSTSARYGVDSRDRVSSAVVVKGLECVAYMPAEVWRARLVFSRAKSAAHVKARGGDTTGPKRGQQQKGGRDFFSSLLAANSGETRPTGETQLRAAATGDRKQERVHAREACEDLLLSVVDIIPALTVGPYPTATLVTARGDRVVLRLRPSLSCCGCEPRHEMGAERDLSGHPLSLSVSSVLPSPFFSAVSCPLSRLSSTLSSALCPFYGDAACSFGAPSSGHLPETPARCSYYSNGLSLFAPSPTLSRLFEARNEVKSEECGASSAFVSLRVSLPSAAASSPFFLSSCLPLQLPSPPLAAGEFPVFFASTDSSPSFSLPPTDGLPPALDFSPNVSPFGDSSFSSAPSPSEAALVRRHLVIVCATEIFLISVDRCRACLAPAGAEPLADASIFTHPPSPRSTAALDASWALETCTASGAAAAAAARARALASATAVLEAAEPWVRAGPVGPRLERLARDLLQNACVLAAALPPSLPAPIWSPSLWQCLFEVASQREGAQTSENAALGLFFSLSPEPLGTTQQAAQPGLQPVFFLRRLHLSTPTGRPRHAQSRRALGSPPQPDRGQIESGEREPDAGSGEGEDDASLGWWTEEEREARDVRRSEAQMEAAPSPRGSAAKRDESPDEQVAPWLEGLAANAVLLLRRIADWPICMLNPSLLDPSVSGSLLSPSSPTCPSSLPPKLYPVSVRWNAAYLATVYDQLNAVLRFLYLQCLPTASLSFIAALLASPLSPAALLRLPPSSTYNEGDAAARARKALLAVLSPSDAPQCADGAGRGERRNSVKAQYRRQEMLLLGLTLSLLKAREIVYLFLLVHEFSPARQQHFWFRLAGNASEESDDASWESHTPPLCLLAMESFFVTAMEHFLASTNRPYPVIALHFALRLLFASLRLGSPSSSPASSSLARPEMIARAFGEALGRGAAKEAERKSAREKGEVATHFPLFLAQAWAQYLVCILNYEIPEDAFFQDGEAGRPEAEVETCEQRGEREERKRAALEQLQWAALDQLFSVYTLQLPPLPDTPGTPTGSGETGNGEETARTASSRVAEARAFGVFGPFLPPGNEYVVSALERLVRQSLDRGVCTPEIASGGGGGNPTHHTSPASLAPSFPWPSSFSPLSACDDMDADASWPRDEPATLTPAALRTLQVYLHRRFFRSGRAAQGDVLLRLYRHQGARVESAAVLCALGTRAGKQGAFLSEDDAGTRNAAELEATTGRDSEVQQDASRQEADACSLLLPITVKAEALRWACATLQEEIDLALAREKNGTGLHRSAPDEARGGDTFWRAPRFPADRLPTTEALLHLFGQLFRTAEEVAFLTRAGEIEEGEGDHGGNAREARRRAAIRQLMVVRNGIQNLSEALEGLQLPLWCHLKSRLESQHARYLLQSQPAACSLSAETDPDLRVFPSTIVPPVSLQGVCTLGQQLETVPNLFHAAQMFFCVPLSLRALLFDFRRLVSLTCLSLLPLPRPSSSSPASPLAGLSADAANDGLRVWMGETGAPERADEGREEAAIRLQGAIAASPQFPTLQNAAETVRETAEAVLFALAARLAVAPDSFHQLTATLDLTSPGVSRSEREETPSLIEKVLDVCMYSWTADSPALFPYDFVSVSPLFPISEAGNLEMLCCLEAVHAFSRCLEAPCKRSEQVDVCANLLVAERWLRLSPSAYASAFQVYSELLHARSRLDVACEALRQGVARLLRTENFAEAHAGTADLSSVQLSFSASGVEAAVTAGLSPEALEAHIVSVMVSLAALWVEDAARDRTQEERESFWSEEMHALALQTLAPFLRTVAEQSGDALARETAEADEGDEDDARERSRDGGEGSRVPAQVPAKARETLEKLGRLAGPEEL